MKRKISDLKVAELKLELEKRGLESKGLKGALVQRLQKAIEDEVGNSSEIEVTLSDGASPKPRRGTPRSRRTPEADTDASQAPIPITLEEKETEQPVPEKAEAMVAEEVLQQEESTIEPADQDQDDVENGVETNEVGEEEAPADAEDEITDVPPEGDEQSFQDEGEPAEEPDMVDEASADAERDDDVGVEGKDNDYRTDEEPVSEPVEETPEETGQEEEEEPQEEVLEQEEVVESGEVAEVEESASVETMMVEEVEEVGAEVSEDAGAAEPSEAVEIEQAQPMDTEPAAVPAEAGTTKPEEKTKTDATGKEQEVSVPEDDVLDMLDYDIEIGDQNNINVQSDDQASKAAPKEGEKTSSKKTDKKPDNSAEKNESSKAAAAPSTDKKGRPGSDSSKKPTTPTSSADASKSGGQSSTKSSTAAKESGKSTSGGKREGTSGSGTSKKDDNPNKNLWISGLSSTTRASELKSAFSRYGKVIGAKVVTNVKSPGSRCYGYVTMATVEAASKCILHLNNTEMHGRMITVEIAKGDPSASSKKQPSASSGSSAKKDAESKDGSKGKDSDSKPSTASGRRPSSTVQASIKSEKDSSENKEKSESDKKTQSDQSKDGSSANRKTNDENKKKSPARGRGERTTSTGGPRSGDKRHNNRSPGVRNRSTSKAGHKDEPERKRARQTDGDRKVVMDSHKGELRVNVSGTNRTTERSARWQTDGRPKALVTRRRSASPVRRRGVSPVRGQAASRLGGAARDFKGRVARGRGGLTTSRTASSYASRTAARGGARSGGILSFSQIRAQQRERDRARGSDRGRGRGGLSQAGQLHSDRDRLRREREEREKLRIERERLERERRQLEKDRLERERLEQERLRLEQERKRELERIEREKAEMRRLQEITRYEVEQRQRAIKRTYDDDTGGGHRSSRTSNSDTYHSKRTMMSDRDVRAERGGRGGDRDERRGYDTYGSRDTARNGPQPSPNYRSAQGSYRGAGDAAGSARNKSTAYHEGRRGAPSQSVSHHETEARYGGVGGGSAAAVSRSTGRNVEKYERRDANRTIDYAHGFERETATDARRVETSPPRRRGQQRDSNDHRDGRKVVRERADHRSTATSPEFRRSGRAGNARVEITRVEQSPPARRGRRGSASPVSARSATWRDTKGATTRRDDDRDLREQIRGGRQSSAAGTYGETARERGVQRRAPASEDSSSPSPPRASGQYQSRWPESATDGTAQQIYATGGNAATVVPTARGGAAASWQHVASWQSAAQSARPGWPGSAIPSTTSPVSRQLLASAYGAVGATPTMLAPPGTTINPAAQAYIPATDRGSRSFQASYKQITRRY